VLLGLSLRVPLSFKGEGIKGVRLINNLPQRKEGVA